MNFKVIHEIAGRVFGGGGNGIAEIDPETGEIITQSDNGLHHWDVTCALVKRRLRRQRRREPIEVTEADWRSVGGDFSVVGDDLRRAMAAYRDSFGIMERGD